MRAVVTHISDEELAQRHAWGLDRHDELWEGVLHMTPPPSVEHQRILDRLIVFWGGVPSARGILRSGIGVFRWDRDYRVPDLTFVSPGRDALFDKSGIRGGGPDAVIEIRSPDDETYEKLPFFAAIGVGEVIVIDRDTKRVEIFRLAGSQYVALQADPDGWLRSESMNVRLRQIEGDPARLVVEDLVDSSRRTEI